MENRSETAIVTVGIPFYNADKYLHEAITSVFAQTLHNWKLILIDDGSVDNSLRIASGFVGDPRVQLISDGRNLGLASRLNQLTELTTTPFLARMDADDLMSPRRIEIQISYLHKHPEIDLTATGLISMTDTRAYVGERYVMWHRASPYTILTQKTGIPHATVVGRVEWFRRNPYNLGFERAEDIELWIRANELGDLKIAFIKECLYFYREFDSTSKDKYETSIRSITKIAKMSALSSPDRFRVNLRLRLIRFISKFSKLVRIRELLQQRRNFKKNYSTSEVRFREELSMIDKIVFEN